MHDLNYAIYSKSQFWYVETVRKVIVVMQHLSEYTNNLPSDAKVQHLQGMKLLSCWQFWRRMVKFTVHTVIIWQGLGRLAHM